MNVILIIFVILLSLGTLFMGFQYYRLRKAVRSTKLENHTVIGKVTPLTTAQEKELSEQKAALKLMLVSVEYKIALHTDILTTNFKDNKLKSDQEKWLEQGQMTGYGEIRAYLNYLISKKEATQDE